MNPAKLFLPISRVSIVLLSLSIFAVSSTVGAQTWVPTGSMTTARLGHTATPLNNGKVLIAGGQNASGILASAELYDPATGTFTATGNMTIARSAHTATLLSNGQVLIAGGGTNGQPGCGTILSSAEIYDPTTGTFTATGSMSQTRVQFAATLLSNGKVLVAGGFPGPSCGGVSAVSSAELYDPTTGTFSATGSMNTARFSFTQTLLNNGKVLVAGGTPFTFPGQDLASAELYDPTTGSFTFTGSMTTPRDSGHTATLLQNGTVLIAGGGLIGQPVVFSSAELYDPSAGTFSATGSMTTARLLHTATLLSGGNVLFAGGHDASSNILASTELYDPITKTFTPTASLTNARQAQDAVLLGNGNVLVAGGNNATDILASAELFQSSVSSATTLSSSANPSMIGEAVTLTAMATPSSGTGTPTGTVTFTDTSTSTTLGTQTLSSGQATLTTSSLVVGTHNITAQYNGDSNFQPSSGSLSQSVEYGLCLLYDQTMGVHSGAVIPIKLELCDANGNNLSTSSIILHATGVVLVSTNTPGTLESPGNANPDNDFRFDPMLGSGGGYIFNLKTSGLGTGTYNLQFTAGNDPVPHAAQFEVK